MCRKFSKVCDKGLICHKFSTLCEVLVMKLLESIDRLTCRHDMTDIMLKTA